jgi:hypothetical protein
VGADRGEDVVSTVRFRGVVASGHKENAVEIPFDPRVQGGSGHARTA